MICVRNRVEDVVVQCCLKSVIDISCNHAGTYKDGGEQRKLNLETKKFGSQDTSSEAATATKICSQDSGVCLPF